MGKTAAIRDFAALVKKHPHVHGEDNTYLNIAILTLETPPRAWGRQRFCLYI